MEFFWAVFGGILLAIVMVTLMDQEPAQAEATAQDKDQDKDKGIER